MKIAYSNKRLFLNCLLGILWIYIGTTYLSNHSRDTKYSYFLYVVGTFYISLFLFEYFKKYVEITEDQIKVNSIPAKEIFIKDINGITFSGNDYIFKTADKMVKVKKSQINKDQLPEFEAFFNKLKERPN